MTDQIRRQIAYYENRIARYPDHEKREWMEDEIRRLNAELQQPPSGGHDRLLNRSERIIAQIRKAKDQIAADPKSAKTKALEARISEWQTSLTNIKEYGTEKPKPEQVVGTKIEIPHDVLQVTDKEVGK